MALEYAHGAIDVLSTDVATTTKTVSGLSFQPKALRFFWVGIQSATDANSEALNMHRGVGFASSTSSRRCVGSFSQDTAATSNCGTVARDDAVMCTTDGAGGSDGEVDLDAINSDGFRLIVDDQLPQSVTIFWEAWGGSDITDVTLGDIAEPAATGEQAYNATGFQPGAVDQAVMFAGVQSTAAVNTAQAVDSGICVGFATGPSNQCVVAGNSDDASTAMDTDGYCSSSRCLAMVVVAGGTTQARAAFARHEVGQFVLNWEARATTNRRYVYMAIKGGGWAAGGYTIAGNTGSATASISGLPFAPKGVSLVGRMTADSGTTNTANDRIGMGCGSSTSSRRSMGVLDEDATASSACEINHTIQYDQVLSFPTTAGALQSAYDINAMNSDGFQIIVDTAGGVASELQGYATFGNQAPAPDNDGQDWYAGVQRSFTESAIAKAGATVALAVALSFGLQQQNEEITQTPVTPTQSGFESAEFVAVGSNTAPQSFEADEDFAPQAAPVALEEGEWLPPPGPVPRAVVALWHGEDELSWTLDEPYHWTAQWRQSYPATQPILGDEPIVPQPASLGVDEEPWPYHVVARAKPWAVVQLGDDEVVTAALYARGGFESWQAAGIGDARIPAQPVGGEDEIGTAAAPLQVDEEYWQQLPWRTTRPFLFVPHGDEERTTAAAALTVDEQDWQILRPWQAKAVVNVFEDREDFNALVAAEYPPMGGFTSRAVEKTAVLEWGGASDDIVPQPSPLQVDEQYWHQLPWIIRAPVAFAPRGDDEIVTAALPLTVDEADWQRLVAAAAKPFLWSAPHADELPVAAALDDGAFTLEPVRAPRPVIQFWISGEDWVAPPVPLPFDEEPWSVWTPPYLAPQGLYLPDPQEIVGGLVAVPVYGWGSRTRIGSKSGRDPWSRIGSEKAKDDNERIGSGSASKGGTGIGSEDA